MMKNKFHVLKVFMAKFKKITLENLIVTFFSSWAVVSLCNIVYHYSQDNYNFSYINYFRIVNEVEVYAQILAVFLLLLLLTTVIKSTCFGKLTLFISVTCYGLVSCGLANSIYYCMGFMVVMTLVVIYCFSEKDGINWTESGSFLGFLHKKMPHKYLEMIAIIVFIIAGIWFIIFTGGLTSLRYLEYACPSMDFGIFSQMFHYMVKNMEQLTTCERGYLMSHFSVHISPVFYLILPFYAVFQSPITLQIFQAVILALGLIPLYLLCKKLKLSYFETIAVGVCYSFYPALSMGCFYDIHENSFLPLFLLLLLFFVECDNLLGIIVCALLVFSVKEDAAIYVAFIALYIIFEKQKKIRGLILLIVSIQYFVFTTYLLSRWGDGNFLDRFSNLIYDNTSVICIIKSVILDPGYVLQQIFLQDNLLFIFEVLAPLCFVPLFVKKWSQLILIGPFILINLMSDYAYFHNIGYQYVFGNIAIFFYLMVLNISTLKQSIRQKVVPLITVFSVMLFITILQTKMYYFDEYKGSYLQYRWKTMDQALDMIPKDVSVTATTFLVPHLSQNDEVYDFTYSGNKSEYIAFDLRIPSTEFDINYYLNSKEFQVISYTPNVIGIFKRIN